MASGDTLLIGNVNGNMPPSSEAATYGEFSTVNSDALLTLDYLNGVDRYGVQRLWMPRHYAGGGVTLSLEITAAATTGSMVWAAQFKTAASGTNLLLELYGLVNQITVAAPGAVGDNVVAEIAVPSNQMDGVTAGDPFLLRVGRLGTDGSDDMAAIGSLHSWELRET